MPNPAITLVFTDVVGSSAAKRAASLGADVSARDRAYLDGIQTEHLRLVRSAVAKHNGKEIMTIGDSFFLTFEDPMDGLRCTAAIQQHLAAQPIYTLHGPLRLRIGMHVGTPEFFENSWHGTDVDTAARVQSAASPRQILVTDTARQMIGDPVGIDFRPLGTFDLKGIGDVKLWDADYDQHGLRSAAQRSNEQKRRTRLLATSVIAVVMLAAIGFSSMYLWRAHLKQAVAKVAQAASSIIITEFENKTGEAVFDSMLTQAFTIQLQQSPVLNLVSPQHLRQSMQYLGKSPEEPLTPALAREIGVREGIKAYLTGSISKLGHAYLVIASAVNTETGDSIASEEAQAPDKDHVLDALSTVATAIRTHLGESLASVRKLDTPLGQATTPSLEAFRAFALGDVEHDKGDEIPGAEGHYRQALEIDPNFAMAWARLGTVYYNTGAAGQSMQCFTRAFELSKNVSERERLYIQAKYYNYVTGDIQKSIDTLQLASQTYPLDVSFYINLAVSQTMLGQIEAAQANFHQAAVLAPESTFVHSINLTSLVRIDRFTEALEAAAELKRHGPINLVDTISIYNLHLLTDNPAAMAQDVSSSQGRADEYLMTGTVAYGQEFLGQYDEAAKSWKLAAEEAAAQKAKDVQAAYLMDLLFGRANAGMGEDVGPLLNTALALDNTKPTLQCAAYTAALCHQPGIALPIMADLARAYPDDTLINQLTLPQSRAALALAAHDPRAALHELEGSESFDLISQSAYLEGLAYLDLHDGPNAVDAFKRATRYRGGALVGWLQNYGQAQLGLARAYSLSGDKPSAKKAYEALFATWKDADADLPQLLAARKEYAALE